MASLVRRQAARSFLRSQTGDAQQNHSAVSMKRAVKRELERVRDGQGLRAREREGASAAYDEGKGSAERVCGSARYGMKITQ